MKVTEEDIKKFIIEALGLSELTPESINSEDSLFKDGLGLDSVDALELGIALQKKYSITVDSNSEEMKKYFYSVKTLVELINGKD